MRIVVLGAGAVGSFIGGALSRAHTVTLVGRDPHMRAVRKDGLRISDQTSLHAHPHAVTSVADAATPELLILTTKAYDTLEALEEATTVLGPTTLVLTLQNGLGNLEAVESVVGPERALGGVTTHGIIHLGPGRVRHAGAGFIRIGPAGPDAHAARRVAGAFGEAGLDVEVVPRALEAIWEKAVVNAGINPITAITGLENGALQDVPELRALLDTACREAAAVARSQGFDLADDDAVASALAVVEATAANVSSMLQDVRLGRRTEIDAIDGEIARRGELRGIPTPVIRGLHALVRGIELTTQTTPGHVR